jgi:hypothetical protein
MDLVGGNYQGMDNVRRGLHSYLGAGLGVCLTELKH